MQAGRAQGHGSAQGRWLGRDSGRQTEGKCGGALQTAGQWEGTGPLRRPARGLPLSGPDDVGGPSSVCPSWLSGPVPGLPLPRSLHRSFTLGGLPRPAVLSVPALAQRPHRWPSCVSVSVALLLTDTDGEFPCPCHCTKLPDVSLALTRNA